MKNNLFQKLNIIFKNNLIYQQKMSSIPNNPTTLDDFKIEKIIGKGSFGSVYLVTRKADQKLYALKTVFLEKLNKKEQENSVNEVRLLASISHPNVIEYKEAFWDDKNSTLNLIMEYADNGDLQTLINKKRKEQRYFNENLIWLYSIQMIEGLKAIHDKKIMHRDLKSANIFLSKKKHQCKIGDMNVSKVIKEKFLTTQTGTPYYASPEVWRDEPYSYKSDLWSIGCVIYEMCALRPPFNGKDLDELFENVCKCEIKRISNYYSDDLWNMILMLLQHDVDKRVDCEEFLNNEIIKKKINQFKKNPNTCFEGIMLEKNKNIKKGDDILLETINFKNLNDLKKQLPSLRNYEKNSKKNINLTNNTTNTNDTNYSKSKNDCNNILITISSIKSNINQNKNNNNVKDNNLNINEKGPNNKNIEDNTNIKSNNNNDCKQKESNNNITENIINQNQKQININNESKENIINQNHKKTNINDDNKENIKQLPKNISFNGIIHSSNGNMEKKEKSRKNGKIDTNFSDRNILQLKSNNNKNKEHIRIEKKKFKEFEKIIEYKKIKELLKNKKNENFSNKTERRIKVIKKSCGNLFRNKTENNNKIENTKTNDKEETGRTHKKNCKIVYSNKSYLMKRINTEQRMSLINKIYSLEFDKFWQNRMIKSPTSIYTLKINGKNKERSHSQGINRRIIGSVKNKKKSLNKKINYLYNNLFDNINNKRRKNFNNKNKILSCTPFAINKKFIEKSTKRNLTTIPYNNESNQFIKSINNYKKQNRLLNEVFNTVNLNANDNIIIRNSMTKKFNYYLNLGNYYSENEKSTKSVKFKKVICKSSHNKSKKVDKIPNINDFKNISNRFTDYNSCNNMIINNSCCNNRKTLKNLFYNKNYSIIIKKKNKNINNDNSKFRFSKKIIYKKTNPAINKSFNPLTIRQKSLASSIGSSLSNSNIDIINKRNSFTYIINKKVNQNEKSKNISIKKLNIPPFCNINKNNYYNYIKYKKNYKNNSNKDILNSEKIIIANRDKHLHKIKKNKKKLNVSVNENYINGNHNTFLHNVKPMYLNLKNNNNMNISRKKTNNTNRNKRINTENSGRYMKSSKVINSQIYNNYYSINNIDASNIPVRIINFYN